MNPHSRDEVRAGLAQAEVAWTAYAAPLPPADFFREPAPGRWSVAQNLRHLALTHGRVSLGLRTPRPVLRTLFGAPETARPYPGLCEAYRAALAAGGKAPARYVPRPDARTGEEAQAHVLREYVEAAQGVRAALSRWPEGALDSHALPHDLLGRVSVRELIFFVLYHDHHHLSGVQASLKRQTEQP